MVISNPSSSSDIALTRGDFFSSSPCNFEWVCLVLFKLAYILVVAVIQTGFEELMFMYQIDKCFNKCLECAMLSSSVISRTPQSCWFCS